MKLRALELSSMKTLGERIKAARGTTSQDAFAKQLDISKGSLGFYERNENLPNVDVALKICSITGCSLEWLIAGRGPIILEGGASTTSIVNGLNKGLLVEVVEVLEEFLRRAKKNLPPAAKAEVIYQLYQMTIEEETDTKKYPLRVIKLIQDALSEDE